MLIRRLEQTCRPNGRWNDERVIVFTEYRDTQNWLVNLLAAAGLGGERLALLYGGMDTEDRERVKAEFQAAPSRSPIRILLATDVASEGIDLQNYCHRMAHVEIPFSPSRLEQRNGRIDRHGQSAAEVLIYHFVGKGFERARPGSMEADLDFLSRMAHKLETIRDELGSAGPLLAAQVEEAMLGRRATIDDSALVTRGQRVRGTLARIERQLREDIARLHEALTQSVETLGITPQAVERVVCTGLELGRQAGLTPGRYSSEFLVPPLTGSWARATAGLADPLDPTIRRPITFDHAIAENDRDVVLVHLGHPLVAQSMRLLRAEIWSAGAGSALSRVSARMAARGPVQDLCVVAHGRLVITGADGHRLHEEVITAGGTVRNARFARMNVGEVARALAAGGRMPAPDLVCDHLAGAWSDIEGPLFRSLEVRAEEVTRGLERKLAARAAEEERNVREILTELRRNISAQLDALEEENGVQLFLAGFGPDDLAPRERDQLQRDIEALRRRLAEIPAEIDREVATIRRRYAAPVHRLFPAAVTFIVPERYALEVTR